MAQPVLHDTFQLNRSFTKPPAQVFAAFSEPEKVRQWFTDPTNSDVMEFSLRFAIGGTQRLVYRLGPNTPVAGMVIINDGHFQDIVPNQRIVTATSMATPEKRLSASLLTIELLPSAGGGTDLLLTHQGAYFEGLGGEPVSLIRQGWTGLLERLSHVVDAQEAVSHAG